MYLLLIPFFIDLCSFIFNLSKHVFIADKMVVDTLYPPLHTPDISTLTSRGGPSPSLTSAH